MWIVSVAVPCLFLGAGICTASNWIFIPIHQFTTHELKSCNSLKTEKLCGDMKMAKSWSFLNATYLLSSISLVLVSVISRAHGKHLLMGCWVRCLG